MRTKDFQTYLEQRLNKKEIAEIEEQALLEKRALQSLPDNIFQAVAEKHITQEKY